MAGSVCGAHHKILVINGRRHVRSSRGQFSIEGIGLLEGGVDLFLVETAQDSLNIKAALIGLDRAMAETGRRVPVSVSATIELMDDIGGARDRGALLFLPTTTVIHVWY